MIYLIGGVSKSGKSFVANEILKNKQIPVFSTDFLLWSLGGENGLFSYYDNDSKVSEILKPYLLKIVDFLVKNDNTYVIEGTHVTTKLYEELNVLYKGKINAAFLGYSNSNKETKYEEIIKYENEYSNKWYKVLKKEDFISFISDKIKESLYLKDECENKGYFYFDITDITKDKDEIIKTLFN